MAAQLRHDQGRGEDAPDRGESGGEIAAKARMIVKANRVGALGYIRVSLIAVTRFRRVLAQIGEIDGAPEDGLEKEGVVELFDHQSGAGPCTSGPSSLTCTIRMAEAKTKSASSQGENDMCPTVMTVTRSARRNSQRDAAAQSEKASQPMSLRMPGLKPWARRRLERAAVPAQPLRPQHPRGRHQVRVRLAGPRRHRLVAVDPQRERELVVLGQHRLVEPPARRIDRAQRGTENIVAAPASTGASPRRERLIFSARAYSIICSAPRAQSSGSPVKFAQTPPSRRPWLCCCWYFA